MKSILVIGDSCRDIYVYCNATRLAPDVPIPVLSIVNQSENGGMAKNVQRNIQLYKDCDIITNSDWVNITKTRYVHNDSNHMFFRVDTPNSTDRVDLKSIDFKNYKLIVVSDYNKGFLSESDIKYICSNHTNVFIDTKKILGNWALDARFIKINNFEYNNSKKYLTTALKEKIIMTNGSAGAVYKEKTYPVKKVEVKDLSGAGDSFMAALVIEYLNTNNIEDAIKFANKKASEVVKHRGVTLI